MKFLIISAFLFSSLQALACRLSQPIPLDTLALHVQRELFFNTTTSPRLTEFLVASPDTMSLPTSLNLSFTKVSDIRENSEVIGARVAYQDTAISHGVSDVYLTTRLERTITNSGSKQIHKVSAYDESSEWYEASEVTIEKNQIISIVITDKLSKYMPATGMYRATKESKIVCVTSAER